MTGSTDAAEPILWRVRDRLDPVPATVTGTVIGPRQLLVELEVAGERVAGVTHRPEGAPPEELATVEGLLAGIDSSDASPIERALAIATLNALSAPHISWDWGDPMEALTDEVDRIATVGLFRPALRKFDDVEVNVIERVPDGIDPTSIDTPDSVRLTLFGPARRAEALAGADVVFVTGSTLIYGGLSDYLQAIPATATIVLVGATASFLPGPAFDAGIDVLAGVAVTDIDTAAAGIATGDCGTDLHDSGLRKGFVAADRTTRLDLAADSDARAE
jgi:uncharacterized protein (DUF4213/DUF364 family)